MAVVSATDRTFLQSVARLTFSNPFLPERIGYEREALGSNFADPGPVWSMNVDDPDRPRANLLSITSRLETLLGSLRAALIGDSLATAIDRQLYEIGALFLLYRRYEECLHEVIIAELDGKPSERGIDFYSKFLSDWRHYFQEPQLAPQISDDPARMFAFFFQLRRAFHLIFRYIIGSSLAAARLRAAVWQSIFTHDMRRYASSLYECMGDIPTLIVGPSGTGKELVARAIGMSRYIPFDAKRKSFAGSFSDSFHALNLSALPSTLIESELFGHRRGAFTGALEDRRGWLDICDSWGSVFLDEVGDLDPAIQVKLLRVLQSRTFQTLGETKEKEFRGKIIAATNRDLAEAIDKGNFRTDFYYRLCADMIVTPSLEEQLRESPQALREMIIFIARGLVGVEIETVAEEIEGWIDTNLGRNYRWPGNFRELEQCVRSVIIRQNYRPPLARVPTALEEISESLSKGALTAEELLIRYCTMVYSQTGSYEETARRLQLDRRTVKQKLDLKLLARFRGRH